MVADVDFAIIKGGSIRGNIRDKIDTKSIPSKVKQLLDTKEVQRVESSEIYHNHIKNYITVTRYSSSGQLLDVQNYAPIIDGAVLADKYALFCDKAKSYSKDRSYRIVEIHGEKILLEHGKNKYVFFIADVYDAVFEGKFGLTNPSKLKGWLGFKDRRV